LVDPDRYVVVGHFTGIFGVMGWIKVHSYTDPKENILDYLPWHANLDGGWREIPLLQGKTHGKGIIAQLEGYTDRDISKNLLGAEIAVRRSQLPESDDGAYYWIDLMGLNAISSQGATLGIVTDMVQTGAANSVLVVTGTKQHLVPFVRDVFVLNVDVPRGRIILDWDPDF
jgi:16S rRNA processing protein RimM